MVAQRQRFCEEVDHAIALAAGPEGEEWCWWQCTVRGGREGRDLGAVELAEAAQALGAGEIMLNCIDQDGTNQARARLPRWGSRSDPSWITSNCLP